MPNTRKHFYDTRDALIKCLKSGTLSHAATAHSTIISGLVSRNCYRFRSYRLDECIASIVVRTIFLTASFWNCDLMVIVVIVIEVLLISIYLSHSNNINIFWKLRDKKKYATKYLHKNGQIRKKCSTFGNCFNIFKWITWYSDTSIFRVFRLSWVDWKCQCWSPESCAHFWFCRSDCHTNIWLCLRSSYQVIDRHIAKLQNKTQKTLATFTCDWSIISSPAVTVAALIYNIIDFKVIWSTCQLCDLAFCVLLIAGFIPLNLVKFHFEITQLKWILLPLGLVGHHLCDSTVCWCFYGIWTLNQCVTRSRSQSIRTIILCNKTIRIDNNTTSILCWVCGHSYTYLVRLWYLGSTQRKTPRKCIDSVCISCRRIGLSNGKFSYLSQITENVK